jgi:hypothetical protein
MNLELLSEEISKYLKKYNNDSKYSGLIEKVSEIIASG